MSAFLRTLIAPVLAAVLAAGGAQAAFWQWSKTAATNATADPSINWAEGMSPSSVNDSARAMMARAAEYRDDISGLLATGGTSTAYTVTTNQGLNSTPQNGQLLAVTPHATNGVAPTLAADGGTAYPIQTSPGVAVSAGTMVLGTPYTMKFSTSSNAWMLRDFYGQPFSVPLGAMIPFTGDTAPNSNFVFPIGQCISRTTYATYFAMVGTRFGACDGTTTFGVPDLRERGIAFQGTMGGASSPGRITTAGSSIDGTTVGAAGGAQNITMARANLPNTTVSVTIVDPGHTHTSPERNNSITTALGAPNSAYPTTGNNVPYGASFTGISASFALNGGVTQTTMNVMAPTMMLTAILRVL